MIDQNFCPSGCPYKFYASPPTIASIYYFDVIADKAHKYGLTQVFILFTHRKKKDVQAKKSSDSQPKPLVDYDSS